MSELKRVAAINDMSGASRCSLTVAIPVLTAYGVQCCALPTAILSNHTGYDKFFFDDYTDKMRDYYRVWKETGMTFDCIYSGFLGSEEQIDIVDEFIRDFRDSGTRVLVDPVMADDGKIYSTYNEKMCDKMRHLIQYADVITPNVTEACILSGMPYTGEKITIDTARTMAKKIAKTGVETIIITGIKTDDKVINYVYSDGQDYVCISDIIPVYYAGTGDLFASIICGYMAQERSIFDAVTFASKFIARTAQYSYEQGIAPLDGVCFEKFLFEMGK
ncbi:MAG: pyridoxamine kinase [Ruminococcaceae bacterium]|nr:pyridoxamine kinase [Oscillospiraceae bacterium]